MVVLVPLIRFLSSLCFTVLVVHLATQVTSAPSREASEPALAYLDNLILKGGELCQVQGGDFQESLFFLRRTVRVSCGAIFGNKVFIRREHCRARHRKVPDKYHDHFTLAGQFRQTVLLQSNVFDQDCRDSILAKDTVDSWIEQARNITLTGNYGVEETLHLNNAMQHASGIKNGRVLVIGSENPWVEAVVLALGASSVVTLEYGKIKSEHLAIETMTPDVFKQKFNEELLDF